MSATSKLGTGLDSLIDAFLGQDITDATRRRTFDLIGTVVSNSVFKGGTSFDAEKTRRLIAKANAAVGNQFGHIWRRMQSQRDLSRANDALKFLVLISDVKSLKSPSHTSSSRGTLTQSEDRQSVLPPVPPRSLKPGPRATLPSTLSPLSVPSTPSPFALPKRVEKTSVRSPAISTSSVHTTGRYASEPVLAEEELVRNVLVALQGIEGQYVRWSPSRNRFTIDEQAPVSAVDRARVSRLLDCGAHYRQIESFGVNPRRGLIVQAFAVAVHDQVKDYLGTLAMLHSQTGSNAPPSLLAIELLTRAWFNRLQCLGDLIEAVRDLRGLQLLSCVHEQWKLCAGDDVVYGCITAVLNAVCAVFHRLLVAWLTEGLIEDHTGEFLIVSKPNVSNACMWSDRYSIRYDMIPSIFERDTELLGKLLVVGKSVAFLRFVHSNRQNEMPDLDVHKRRLLGLSVEVFYEHAKRKELKTALSAMYSDVSDHLLTVMSSQFMLKSHLRALKNYMLLGSADFARNLFDELSSELDSETDGLPSASVVGRAIVTALESARPGEHPSIVACLDAEPWTDATGDDNSPLDAFTLKYRIAGPITAILPEKILRSYQKLFKFIWSVHRLEFALTQLWKTHKIESPRFSNEIEHSAALSKMFSLLFMEMITMLRKFHFYLLYDVIDHSWKELKAALDKQPESFHNTGFDYVIKTHETFVTNIEYRLFLTEDFEDLGSILSTTLEHLRTLAKEHKKFVEKCSAELETRAIFELDGEQRLADESWAIDQERNEKEIARREQFAQDLLQEFKPSLDLLKDQYRASIGELLRALRAQRDQVNLNHLFTQLDFARFYQRIFPDLAETPHSSRKTFCFSRFK
uniref:Gamma-tubulin complex component n=1 Tax=Plectus sambesii TaxID=2011161 RepID=A0A914XS56_9BILA